MVDWGSLDYAKGLGTTSGLPLYQRIAGLIREHISEGRLSEGDVLPTEREFARLAGLSRGTVSQAYDELKRAGIVAAAPGRGSVVASDRNVSTSSRKEQAIRILGTAIERLEGLGFTSWEIEAFTHLLLQGREVRVRAVLVDCNPEALSLLRTQLGTVSHLDLEPLLLEDYQRLGAEELSGFELVLTTESHEPQVMGHLARLRLPLERFLSVAVSPTRDTLITLARLPEDARIAVRAGSRRFAEIIQRLLAGLGHADVVLLTVDEPDIAGRRLVVPAPASGLPCPDQADLLLFDYQVDRGSILRVEEAVTSLLLQKGEGVAPGR